MSLVFAPTVAMGVNLDSAGLLKNAQKTSGYANADDTTLSKNVGKIINVALSLMGTIFVVLLVYAGFTWMTAQGETEKIDKAKKTIISSIIGLTITLAAYSISNFVVSKLIENTIT